MKVINSRHKKLFDEQPERKWTPKNYNAVNNTSALNQLLKRVRKYKLTGFNANFDGRMASSNAFF